MADSVLYEQKGRTVLLTLNRPDTRNALSSDIIDQLVAGLEKANADRSVGCVVLTGQGRAFCSGGPLNEIRRMHEERHPADRMKQWYRSGVHRLPKCIQSLDIVSIAAVNGFAIGAGCDLAAMCDLRIAGASALFNESFLNLGIIPGDGGAWLLTRIIGIARTKEMLFSPKGVNAEKALAWGLVNRVAPDESLVEEAVAWAEEIASLPPEALRQAKRLVQRVERATLDEHLEQAVDIQVQLQRLEDHAEALDALQAKRKPTFKGSML
jgi:enoyl-CoA hydratase/carnithine racemase